MLEIATVDSEESALRLVESVRESAMAQIATSMADLERDVSEILSEVRAKGDRALLDYTRKFDGVDLAEGGIEVSPADLEAAVSALPEELLSALENTIDQLREYFESQYAAVAGEFEFRRSGIEDRFFVRAVKRAGVYVPGGRYRYPSTVLMTVIPAEVAGVEEVVLCTPPARTGFLDPLVAAAARLAGADRVFMVGGVQAIAAMAYGTETVPRVDLVVGPGNAYVTVAKKLVFGEVGIDSLAGPSELVVVAADSADWEWVASDMSAQAEHGPGGVTIAAVFSSEAAEALQQRLREEIEADGRPELAQNLKAGGAIAICADEDLALALVEAVAPEHVQISLGDDERSAAFAERIGSAGAIFVGEGTPVALGDYVAGPSHVLPTGGAARFQSGLGVYTFLRYTNSVRAVGLAPELESAALELANSEGMRSHRRSIEARGAARTAVDGPTAEGPDR